jgi:hypothetical protein
MFSATALKSDSVLSSEIVDRISVTETIVIIIRCYCRT